MYIINYKISVLRESKETLNTKHTTNTLSSFDMMGNSSDDNDNNYGNNNNNNNNDYDNDNAYIYKSEDEINENGKMDDNDHMDTDTNNLLSSNRTQKGVDAYISKTIKKNKFITFKLHDSIISKTNILNGYVKLLAKESRQHNEENEKRELENYKNSYKLKKATLLYNHLTILSYLILY